jgi:hypothetical protein
MTYRADGKKLAMTRPTDDSVLPTAAVLAYLNVNLRTAYRLIKAGSHSAAGSAASGGSASATSMPGWRVSGCTQHRWKPRLP